MAALPDYLEDKAIPPFLAKTFYMLNVSSLRDYVRWADDGKSFIVLKADTLAKEVFPKFFKHNKFSSFVRQLNMYGFSKVNTDGQVMTFYHEMFSRDGVKHLKDIKRRKNVTAAAAAGPDGGEVEDMRDEVISLKRSRDEFEEELTTFRESHERMEEEMENVLQANKRMVADLARVNNEQAVLKARMDTVLEFLGNISASMNFTDVVMRASGDLTVAPPSKRFKASTPPLSATMALEGDAFLDFLLTSGGAVDHMMSDAVPTA